MKDHLILACVASVSNRVTARKSFFFALVPTFSTNSRGNACYAGYLIHKNGTFLLSSCFVLEKKFKVEKREYVKEPTFSICSSMLCNYAGYSENTSNIEYEQEL